MTSPTSMFKLDRATGPDALIASDPFNFIIASDTLELAQKPMLQATFPTEKQAGYFPLREDQEGTPIGELVKEITAPRVADTLGQKLGIEKLSQYPTLVTLSRTLNHRHGKIHTDSDSKIATALIYVNDDWKAGSEGCLRMLKSPDDMDAVVAPEVRPIFGNFVIFKRADNSYHGHLPYEGERRVVQIAWVKSQADIDRKTKRGRVSGFVKRLLGDVDKKLGKR